MSMSEIPKECRARFEWICERAEELMESFINGNRKSTVEALESMEPRVALAVLSEMMVTYGQGYTQDLWRFLREVA